MPDKPEVEKLNEEHVNALAKALSPIIEMARMFDKSVVKVKAQLTESMLAIARSASNIIEFNAAVLRVNLAYKDKHRTKQVPRPWTQAASDIRRMFAEGLDVNAKDKAGNLPSYNQLRKMASTRHKKELDAEKDRIQKEKPECVQNFEGLHSAILNTKDGEFISECNTVLGTMLTTWLEQHPQKAEESPDEDEDSGIEDEEEVQHPRAVNE